MLIYCICLRYFPRRSIRAKNQDENEKERRKRASFVLMTFTTAFSMMWQSWRHFSTKENPKRRHLAIMAFAMDFKPTFYPYCTHGVRHEATTSAMDFKARKIANARRNPLPLQLITLSFLSINSHKS